MADCTPSKADGTEGTATCEMTYKEGKKTIHGCIVKNDGNLQTFIKEHEKQSADMKKLIDTKYLFYSYDPDFKEQTYTRTKVTFRRFTKPRKLHSHVFSSPLRENIVKVDKHIFLPCDFQDFNANKFLCKYSKEVLAGQDLNLNTSAEIDVYGLSYEEEDGLKFIPLKLSHHSSNVYGVDAKYHKMLKNAGPVLGQDKKTVIGRFGKKEENKIYISIFGNNQGDPAADLPTPGPSERHRASALPPPGRPERDRAPDPPPPDPSGGNRLLGSVRTNTMAQSHKDIKENTKIHEQNIKSLKEELKRSFRNKDEEITTLRKEIKENKERLASVEEELSKSRGNEKSIQDRIIFLVNENKSLKVRIAKLEKILEDQKTHNKEEKVVIIAEIRPALQKNMCKYVLGEHFSKNFYYKFKDIETYIDDDLKQQSDRDLARERLEHLKKNIPWNQRLVDSLKTIKQKRIDIAHPQLSSEKIQQAIDYLKNETDILDEEMVEHIHQLKEQWETSERLLQQHTTKIQDQGSPRYVPSTCTGQIQTEQTQDTYASKAASRRGDPYTSRKD